MRNFATIATLIVVVQANVPFPFVVNGRTLPAGKYAVERDDLTPSALVIRPENGKGGTVVMAMPDAGTDPAGNRPALTFDRFENQYRLSGVWQANHEGMDVVRR